MKYRRSAGEVAKLIQDEFGYIALGTDDDLQMGEVLEGLTCQSMVDPETIAVVTGMASYAEYEKQAAFAGFADTCRDCFPFYFRIELRTKGTSTVQ